MTTRDYEAEAASLLDDIETADLEDIDTRRNVAQRLVDALRRVESETLQRAAEMTEAERPTKITNNAAAQKSMVLGKMAEKLRALAAKGTR